MVIIMPGTHDYNPSTSSNSIDPNMNSAQISPSMDMEKYLISVIYQLCDHEIRKYMKSEEDRLLTYVGWPNSNVDPKDLAKAGFYSTTYEDVVRCAFCNVEICRWEAGDNPMTYHQKWSNTCPFVRGVDVGNIPLCPNEIPRSSHDTCGRFDYNLSTSSNPTDPNMNAAHVLHSTQNQNTIEMDIKEDLISFMSRPYDYEIRKNMKSEEDRLLTYVGWPNSYMDPKDLAKVGFYSTMYEDVVRCAFCNVEVCRWEAGDNAMTDHQRWSNSCPFVRGVDVGNIPLLRNDIPRSGQGTCGRYDYNLSTSSNPTDLNMDAAHISQTTQNKGTTEMDIKEDQISFMSRPYDNGIRKNMKSEEDRLLTYVGWPNSYMDPKDLAKAGFYSTRYEDVVRCAFCNVEICRWEAGDNAMTDHQRWSNTCPFVRGVDVGNIPLRPNEILRSSHDTCGRFDYNLSTSSNPTDPNMNAAHISQKTQNKDTTKTDNIEDLKIFMSRPYDYEIRKNMKSEEDRLLTYVGWPNSYMDPKDLAKAGFYSTRYEDVVRCAFCNVEICRWEAGDNAMTDHQRWSNTCPFVRGVDVGNIPLRPNEILRSSHDTCGRFDYNPSTSSNPTDPNMDAAHISQTTQNQDTTETDNIEDLNFFLTMMMSETYENMESEEDRLLTHVDLPNSYMDPQDLAEAGFYSTRYEEICRWEAGGNAMRQHQRWSNTCPFAQGVNVSNIPLLSNEIPRSSQGTCGRFGTEILPNPNSVPQRSEQLIDLHQLGITLNRPPAYPNYSTPEARLRSFGEWRYSITQKPEKLSDAGFFYEGEGDLTRCFCCGGGLKSWLATEEPWERHARRFPKCSYVLMAKGPEYVTEVSNGPPAAQGAELRDTGTEKQAAVAKATADEKKVDDDRLCKICYTEELGIVFLPCKHLVACVKCAPSLTSCAICRQPFTATVRAFKATVDEAEPAGEKKVGNDRLCKICSTEELGVVFLPCGHIVACVKCASSVTTCAVCRKPFKATIRAFLL